MIGSAQIHAIDGESYVTLADYQALETRISPPQRRETETRELPHHLRTGRNVGRTIYAQAGHEPSDTDALVGVMDTRELATAFVDAYNSARSLPTGGGGGERFREVNGFRVEWTHPSGRGRSLGELWETREDAEEIARILERSGALDVKVIPTRGRPHIPFSAAAASSTGDGERRLASWVVGRIETSSVSRRALNEIRDRAKAILAASPSTGGSERAATVRCICNADADGTPIYPPGQGAEDCPYCDGRGEVAGVLVMELACPREGCDRRGLRLPDGEVVVLSGCPRLDCPVMRGHGRCVAAPSSSSGESGHA